MSSNKYYTLKLSSPCGPTIYLNKFQNYDLSQTSERIRYLIMEELYSLITNIDNDSYKFLKNLFDQNSFEAQLLYLLCNKSHKSDVRSNLLFEQMWKLIEKSLEKEVEKIIEKVKNLEYPFSTKSALLFGYTLEVETLVNSLEVEESSQTN